jgi:hypothetical protein
VLCRCHQEIKITGADIFVNPFKEMEDEEQAKEAAAAKKVCIDTGCATRGYQGVSSKQWGLGSVATGCVGWIIAAAATTVIRTFTAKAVCQLRSLFKMVGS